jgi:protease-4
MDQPSGPPAGDQTPYVKAEAVKPAPVALQVPASPPRARSGWGWIAMLLFLGLGGSLFLNLILLGGMGLSQAPGDTGLQEQYHSLSRTGREKVAVISVNGAILSSEGFIKKQIDSVKADKDVKAVVLRVDSPGGRVTACDYLLHHLNEMTKERDIPLVVSMGGMAASGGYYLSMAVGDTPDSIFAEPATWSGSIGVIIPHYDFSGLMQEYDVKEDSIASHELKGLGSPFKQMTEAERAILQSLVDDSFDQFKAVIGSGRPYFVDHDEELTKVATGQVFTTKQAMEYKLVDREGFIEDAIQRAIELARLDRDKVRVVSYTQQTGILDQVLFGPGAQAPQLAWSKDLETILDLSVPQAYYLFAWPATREESP